MICKDKMYIVYEHVSPSNKRYIGITCQIPEQRWQNGNGYKQSTAFYNAIQKYGWENFQHNILFENLTAEEAVKKERELIQKYKTTDKNYGYNILSGGELGSTKINPNDIYFLWDKGLTIAEISKELNFNRNTIANYIKKHYNLSSQQLFKIGNIRCREEINKEREKMVLSLWQNENLTQQDIHNITGYNIKTIRNILEKNGINEKMRRSRSATISNKKRKQSICG